MFKKILNFVYQVLESKIVVLLIGIFLTNIIVKNIEHKHQSNLQNNERLFQLFDYKIKFVERLSQLSCDKLYALRRVSWAFGKNQDEKAAQLWDAYLEISHEWNRNLVNNKLTIETFASDTLSHIFLAHDYERIKTPTSLHAHFDSAHRDMLEWMNYQQVTPIEQRRENGEFRNKVERTLNELDAYNNFFIKQLHRSLLNETIAVSKE